MSLLQKASIITTPTAYAEDYLYSIKPALKVSDTEIITNGDFSNGLTNWTASTSPPTLNADNTVTFDSSTEFIFQSISKTVGRRYRLTFDGTGNLRYRTGFAGTDAPTKEIVLPAVIDIVATSNTNRVQPYGSTLGTGVLKSISLKEITDADFDFDRNSTGTRVNEDYLIEDVPYNLASYSESFENWSTLNAPTVTTNIALAPDGTFTADGLQDTTGGAFRRIKNSISVSGNPTFTGSCYIKKVSSETAYTGFVLLFSGTSTKVAYGVIDSVNGTITSIGSSITPTFTVESANNDYWRFTITATDTGSNTSLEFGIYATLSTNKTALGFGAGSLRTIWGAQLVKGDQPKDYLKTTDRLDIPRIDYTNGEPSILLEPQRTNLVTYSEALTTYWTLQGVSLVADNTAINPTGNTFANKINSLITGNFRSINRVETSAWDSKTLTMSCFAKKITNDYIFFYNIGSVSGINGLWFNISNGTIGTNGAAWSNAKIENYGNGWYRCSAKITFGTSDNYLYISNSDGDNITSSTVGSQTYIWGTQIEEGSYATSLIHTSGSTVTRSADAANNAGNSDLINSTEGVVYAEIKALANDGTSRHFSINDGTAANKVEIYYDSTTNEINGHINVSGASSALFSQTFATVLEYHKVAVKYKANDFSMFVDGRQIATDTSGVVFPANTLNNLAFDKGNATLDFYADVKSVMVFKEALTDLELEKLTGYNNHELYMNYYNRLSYLGLVEEYNVESDINNYIL